MKLIYLLIAVMTMFLMSCTEAKRAKMFNLGDTAKITCYSGVDTIYTGFSTGKILSEETSDGYYFREKGSDRLMEVSGNCVIIYED